MLMRFPTPASTPVWTVEVTSYIHHKSSRHRLLKCHCKNGSEKWSEFWVKVVQRLFADAMRCDISLSDAKCQKSSIWVSIYAKTSPVWLQSHNPNASAIDHSATYFYAVAKKTTVAESSACARSPDSSRRRAFESEKRSNVKKPEELWGVEPGCRLKGKC